MALLENRLSNRQIAAIMARAIHRREFKAMDSEASNEQELAAWLGVRADKTNAMLPAVHILRKRGLITNSIDNLPTREG